jgi:hypothetical protein
MFFRNPMAVCLEKCRLLTIRATDTGEKSTCELSQLSLWQENNESIADLVEFPIGESGEVKSISKPDRPST